MRTILTSRRYLGEFAYGPALAVIPELAIVDHATFDSVKARAADNVRLSQRIRKRDHLLSGYLRCSCGLRLVASCQMRHYCYYQCVSSRTDMNRPRCKGAIRIERLEPLVWDWVLSIVTNPREFAAGLRRMAEREAAALQPIEVQADQLAALHVRTARELASLAREIRQQKREKAKSALRVEMDNVAKQLESCESEQAKVAARLAQLQLTTGQEEQIVERARLLKDEFAGELDFETMRYFLGRLKFAGELRIDAQGLRWLHVSLGLDWQYDLSVETRSSYRRARAKDKPNWFPAG